MKILIIDTMAASVDFAIRCMADGHEVRVWMSKDKKGDRYPVGDGLIDKVSDWQSSMKWADLVFLTDNVKQIRELERYREEGYPIFGCNCECQTWELERGIGQNVLAEAGIKIMESTVFTNYDKAKEFVLKTGKRYVSKPTGDADKALSYVSKGVADMIFMLDYWKQNGKIKSAFLLQEFTPGIEMAVGGWFGKNGFSGYVLENFEFKKLMNGDVGVNCFSADTEILTKRGWLRFDQVTLDDEFCSHDSKTGSSFWEKAEKIHWTHYKGEMVRFKNRYIDLLTTPTHNMLVKRRKTTEWKVVPANQCPSEFSIPQTGFSTNPDYGDVVLPDGTVISGDAWMQLMGLYLSEGCVDKDRPRVTIYQNPGSKQDIMVRALRETKFDWYVNDNRISVTHEGLADYLRDFGLSKDKFIPPEIFSASARQINLFLEAFNLGDGDNHYNRRRYCSGSSALIGGIQALMFLIGKAGTITADTRTEMVSPVNGKVYAAQPVYSVEESGRSEVGLRSGDVTYEQYDGMIGCVTLSTTHLIVVRRNGRVAVTHNTGEMGTAMKYVPIEDSKLAQEMLIPIQGALYRAGYTGFIDVSVIIDEKGQALPLEFTCRPGWPLFQIQQALHPDPVCWMKELLEGEDCFKPNLDIALGVVIAIPDFPYTTLTRKEVSGFPIWGITEKNIHNIHLSEVMLGELPVWENGKLKVVEGIVSAGDYLLTCSGTGKTVSDAKEKAYKVVKSLEIPNSPMYRTDIGDRLEKQLPILQSLGYATDWKFS